MTNSTLTDVEVEQLRQTYDSYTHGHGMNASTLGEIYRKAKLPVTQEELERQIAAASSKKNGKLDFDDFLTVMTRQYETNPEEGATKVFEMLDTDKDGLISAEDLERCIKDFGENVTQEELKEMVLSADVDGDGLINFEEFLKVMTPSKVNGQK
ncbi:EF-hand [Hesseltinella vesiculosa]|uniref:EF-hand n=1 Tax=Hesseltinella vesiculosa TaxID=101127 RepID=A0A1X2GXK5_9FUNG|nr:EF-hand [Hesseltinella vesiculosa]